MMYPINEIFYSLQGEGYHTGTPAVFVRFSGCNLHCAFCDTDHRESKPMTSSEIIDDIAQYPNAQLIVLTGGEPSLFADDEFVHALKTKTGLPVAIETNGTRVLSEGIDWVTLSPKEAFEGGGVVPCVINRCDELKVVYCGQDLAQYEHIEAKHRFLQPCYSDDPLQCQANMAACVQAVLNHKGWRLSLQTHRILGIR